jgi:tight adherence protein C
VDRARWIAAVSVAVLLVVAAAVSAAAAISELLTAPRRPRAETAPRIGHLAGMAVLLARIARRAGVRAAPHDLDARLAAAGAPLGLGAGDIVALKGAAAVAALLCAFSLHGLLPGRLGLVALLAAPAAGYVAPELIVARRARARERQIAREIADVLDLLRVAVAAGLPVGRAIGEVGRRMRGVLADELAAAAVRLQLGAARNDVLRQLVARCPGPGVATLAAAIARSDRHGAPLAPALTALAAEARAEQSRRVRDDAARAAPKIQLVVALVLVPAVMLLVGAVLVQGLSGSH